MRRLYRQLLLFTSTVVFMALAPLIVFYAMGYRISSSASPAVGVLLIDSTPRRANITIDDKDIGRAPRSISNLPPGEVALSVSLPGYVSWQKQVSINAAEVTEFRSLRLFPAEPTRATLLPDVSSFSLAPNRQLIAALSDRRLHILDPTGEPISPPWALAFDVGNLLWSPDSNQLLLIGNRRHAYLNLTDQHPPEIIDLPENTRDLVWDPRVPGRLLFIAGSDLFAYHTASQSFSRLAVAVEAFATSSRHIYLTNPNTNAISVLNLQGAPQYTIPLADRVARLLVTPAGQIIVRYVSGEVVSITEDSKITTIAPRAERLGFSPSGQLLYIQSDPKSLHVYNLSDERLRHLPLQSLSLIIRLSRPIQDPQWFAGGHHLIYQVDDEIIITEIDTRDRPLSYQVDSTNLGTSHVSVGENGDTVYYLKNIDGSPNLIAAQMLLE